VTDTAQAVQSETAVEGFAEKVLGDYAGANAFFMAALGDRLGLFVALASNEPQSSAELADRTGLQERYLREWLAGMAAAGYLTYDPPSGCYAMPDAHVPVLAEEAGGIPGRFDVITTFDVIHDSTDPQGIIRAIRDALQPTGRYICVDINCAENPEDNAGHSAQSCTDPASRTACRCRSPPVALDSAPSDCHRVGLLTSPTRQGSHTCTRSRSTIRSTTSTNSPPRREGELMDQTSTIRRAGTRDKHASLTSWPAFGNDPFMTWLLPTTETRLRRLQRFFMLLVLSRMDVERECFITEHGAAVWAPPGKWRTPASRRSSPLRVRRAANCRRHQIGPAVGRPDSLY
jgi:SAM-dependent methyltransferase